MSELANPHLLAHPPGAEQMPGKADEGRIEKGKARVELVRECRNRTFQQCIDAIPGVGDLLSECPEIGWKAFEEKCCEYLLGRLAGTEEEAAERFQIARDLHSLVQFEGGDEHYIALPSDQRLRKVLKWTYGNNFGLKLNVYEVDPEGMNRNVISTGNIDPRYYLRRWIILNAIGLPITRFEGLLPPDLTRGERLPRIAISQKKLSPENPSRREIVDAFHRIGFVEVSEHAYYRASDNVLLGDAAPRNVRLENGEIVPFDAVAEHPTGSAQDWCYRKIR